MAEPHASAASPQARPDSTRLDPDQMSDRLDSWKEIAGYLKRYVTTVQRWEKREGMPVHRHLHDRNRPPTPDNQRPCSRLESSPDGKTLADFRHDHSIHFFPLRMEPPKKTERSHWMNGRLLTATGMQMAVDF